MCRLLLSVAAVVPPALVASSPAFAESPATKRRANRVAAKMVVEALKHELDGDNQSRLMLLEKAIETSPTADTARWLAGYIHIKRLWVAIEEVPAVMAKDKRLASYVTRRDRSSDTVAGHVALARWCGKRGLESQQRAHWARVVQLDPNHVETRRALGHRWNGATWITPEDTKAAADKARWVARSLREWSPQLAKHRQLLDSRSRRTRAGGRPAAAHQRRGCRPGDRTRTRQPLRDDRTARRRHAWGYQDATGLAGNSPRCGLFAVAAGAPRRRQSNFFAQLNSYAPMLLASMSTPLKTGMQLARGPQGGLLLRHTAYGERQVRGTLAVRDTFLPPVVMPDDVDEPQEWRRQVAVTRQQVVAAEVQQAAVETFQRNRQVDQWNQRVGEVLVAATGVQLPHDPEPWWQWWDDYNDQYTPGPKPVQTTYTYGQEEVKPTYRSELKPPPPRHECLAAGTVVWTASGAAPIEQIALGDLVLSQHPDSGELAYKPVLRTTKRPPERLVQMTAGDAKLDCTGGHPFWVAGSGWTNARTLKPGSHLHGATGTTTVSGITDADTRPTYNLIIADFHTYFVGPDRVLSHDNTVQKPTSSVVPGLPLGQDKIRADSPIHAICTPRDRLSPQP